MNNLQKISEHKYVIQPSGAQRVPIELNVSEELLPDDFTINQLKEVASDSHVFHHTVALTDVHQKVGRRNPSGSVVATDGYFMPQLIDTAPNCGMRLITTPFGEGDFSKEQLHDLFNELVEVIPTKTYVGTPLSRKTILDVSRKGTRPLLEKLGANLAEVENTQMSGNMFDGEEVSEKDLLRAVPSMFFRIAQLRLGILGAAGNHFLDLMKVEDILDEEIAEKFGVKKGQYLFMIHTGSGMFGQYASYFYTPKIKELFSQRLIVELARFLYLNDNLEWHRKLEVDIPKYKDKKEFFAIPENSDLGRNYYIAHRAAGNHGFANRALLQNNLKKAFKRVLKKDPGLKLIYDMSHVYANRENHFGKDLIIHRSNTSRAFGPTRMKQASGNKLFHETGEPVFLPSSMSTPAYFGVALDSNEQTYFSAAHGTGKSKTKTSEVPEDKKALFEKMKKRNVRLYNAQSRGVVDQDASHYKDVEKAVAGMQANGIMKPVAKMMPVSVLMA